MTRSRRDATLSAVILVVAIAVSLLIAEGALRFKNSSGRNYDIEMWRYARELKAPSDIAVLGHEHIPGRRALLQNVDIRINNHGLRGPPVQSKSGGRRILFLGSSITLGWGVDEPQIATSRIAEMFRRDSQEVEVLNAGIGNYNTARYVELYLTRLANLEPTDIVIHYFVNDAEELLPGGGNFILRHSQLAVTLWSAFHRVFGSTGEAGLEAHYRAVYEPSAAGYQAMLAALRRLAVHARARGARVILAVQPDVHNLENYRLGFIHERMAEVAAELGVTYVNLYPAFADQKASRIWAMSGDPHPNAFGHQLIAEALYPVLKAR